MGGSSKGAAGLAAPGQCIPCRRRRAAAGAPSPGAKAGAGQFRPRLRRQPADRETAQRVSFRPPRSPVDPGRRNRRGPAATLPRQCCQVRCATAAPALANPAAQLLVRPDEEHFMTQRNAEQPDRRENEDHAGQVEKCLEKQSRPLPRCNRRCRPWGWAAVRARAGG